MSNNSLHCSVPGYAMGSGNRSDPNRRDRRSLKVRKRMSRDLMKIQVTVEQLFQIELGSVLLPLRRSKIAPWPLRITSLGPELYSLRKALSEIDLPDTLVKRCAIPVVDAPWTDLLVWESPRVRDIHGALLRIIVTVADELKRNLTMEKKSG